MATETDKIEIEYKFTPFDDDETTLSLIRAVAVPPWAILRLPPVTVLDIYFDTEDLFFHQAGASFRVRKRGKPYQRYLNPLGYSANFKGPTRSIDSRILEKREVRSAIEADEVLSYLSNSLPGNAALLAYQFIEEQSRASSSFRSGVVMAPVAHIVSARRVYNVGPVGTSWPKSRHPPWGALVHVVLEEVTACDIRGSRRAADCLITEGRMDLTEPVEARRWLSGEVELAHHFPDLRDEGKTLFQRIVERFHSHCLTTDGQSKYSTFMNMLTNL